MRSTIKTLSAIVIVFFMAASSVAFALPSKYHSAEQLINGTLPDNYTVNGTFTFNSNVTFSPSSLFNSVLNLFGIGTTTPYRTLQVNGTFQTNESVYLATGQGSGLVGINNTSPNSTLHIVGTGTTGGFRVTNQSNWYEAFFVNSTLGRVGIGTMNPASTLEVAGDILMGANAIKSSNLLIKEVISTRWEARDAADTAFMDFEIRDLYYYDNIITQTTAGEIRSNGASGGSKVELSAWDLDGSSWIPTAGWYTGNNPYFDIPKSGSIIPALGSIYSIGSALLYFSDIYTNNLYTTGSVGIGTVSPNSTLHIASNRTNGDGFLVSNASNNVNVFTVNATLGMVGVGTTNPTQRLTVLGDANVTGSFIFGNVTYRPPTSDGSSGQILSTDGAGLLSWVANGGGSMLSVGSLDRKNFTSSLNSVLVLANQSWNFTDKGQTNLTNASLKGNLTLQNIQGCNKLVTDSSGIAGCGVDAGAGAATMNLDSSNFSTTYNLVDVTTNKTNNFTQPQNFTKINVSDVFELQPLTTLLFPNNIILSAMINSLDASKLSNIGFLNYAILSSFSNITGTLGGLGQGNFSATFNTYIGLTNQSRNVSESWNLTSPLVDGYNLTERITGDNVSQNTRISNLEKTKADSPVVLGYTNLTGSISKLNSANLTNNFTILSNFSGGMSIDDIMNVSDRIKADNSSQNARMLADNFSQNTRITDLENTRLISPLNNIKAENLSSSFVQNLARKNETNNFTQGQIWSAPSNITTNVTYQLPQNNGEVCPIRYRGITQNYTFCLNSTGQVTERLGVFVLV